MRKKVWAFMGEFSSFPFPIFDSERPRFWKFLADIAG